jgi:UDP-N-acetylmuramoyl-tripeptide--D-alanyl-D-alanine ligase
MTRFLLRDVLAGTGGELRGDLSPGTVFPELQRDSREVKVGDLFIAVKGLQFDGHMFVPQAIQNRAAAAIVSRDWADEHPDAGIPVIVVDAPIAALQRWSAWRRAQLNVQVIGITGSVGKTSAKESIAAVLSQRFRVYKSPGNFNNEIGLPLSLLETPDDAEILVLEMGGAYAFGELTLLAEIAKPSVGVVTNIYPVHLERMGTIEAIAQTKRELVEAIPDDGLAVLNGDDPRVRAMASAAKGRVITYGLEQPADIRAGDVRTDGLKGTSFWVTIDGEETSLKVPFVGVQGVQIALVALAVGHGFGMHVSEMLVGLQDPSVQVRLLFVPGPAGSQLIDDTYNASTPSVLAALGLLDEIPAKRKIAVLGEMRELGELTEEEHRVVGGRAGDLVDVLVTFGDLAHAMQEEAQSVDRPANRPLALYSFSLDQREALVAFLKHELREGDIVLLKGSRGLEMETIVTALRSDAGPQAADTRDDDARGRESSL